MQAVERELELSKEAIQDAADTLEKSRRRSDAREKAALERELRERRPQGRSGISGSQR